MYRVHSYRCTGNEMTPKDRIQVAILGSKLSGEMQFGSTNKARNDLKALSKVEPFFSMKLWLAAVFLLLVGTTAHAQFRTSIQGSVTDPSGAVIPGATLTLTDTATNNKLVRTSNSEGIFNFNALAADKFTLVVEMKGFQKKVLENLELIPEQANALNVVLQVTGGSETVTVDASQGPALETENASTSATISDDQIQHMPSFGRDVFQLSQLAPGSFGDGSQASGGGTNSLPGTQGPGGPGASTGIFATENGPQVLAAGGQYENNSIAIDGISTVSAVWGGTSVITPTEDSIGNVKIVSNGYDAENGRFSGAQIQVTSKSGTNNIHGSAFFSANRPGLNAYQKYNNSSFYNTAADGQPALTPEERGLQRNDQQYNQYGGSIGGPIWKDKVFAFFAYETQRNNSSVQGSGWYETAALDKLAPAGSIASTLLNFPGAQVAATGQIDSTCQQAGLIEGVTCKTINGALDLGSPLKSALGKQDLSYVSSTQPGLGSGFDGIADIAQYATLDPTSIVEEQYNGRLDADATKNDHLSFAIYWVPVTQTDYNGPVRPYDLFHHDAINDAVSVVWNHTFSPTLLNEARANAAGWRWNELATNPQAPFGLPNDSVANTGPNSAIQSFGGPYASQLDQWTYGYRDILTKVLNRHTIKVGAELTRLYYLNVDLYDARPSYTFFNIWDFLNDAPEAEQNSHFNPLTGAPTANRQDNRENLLGVFVQDDFKVRPNLTVNLGLRYTYNGPLTSKENNINVVVPGTGASTLTALSVPTRTNLYNVQKGNFGPQLGFAYSPEFAHDKLVVRGGFGLNFNQEEIAISANGNNNPPAVITPNFVSPNAAHINPDIIYGVSSDVHSFLGFPVNPHAITSFNANNLPNSGNIQVTAFPNTLPTMYTYHYSLDLQYDLGHQMVATAAYQGSNARHTYYHYDLNAVAAVEGIPFNPAVNSVNDFGNEGHGNYNALLLGFKRDFAHQFSANADFTWAKSMDTSSAPYSEDPYPYNTSLSYGRSDYNFGKAFKAYGMWQPVFFHGSHAWVEKVAGGWSISGIFNLHTGFPWTPVYNSLTGPLYCSSCGYSSLRPAAYLGGAGHDTSNSAFESGPHTPRGANKNYPLAVAQNGALAYYSAPAYTPAALFPAQAGAPQAPGVSRNSLDGPGYKDLDATLSKAFGLPHIPMSGNSEGTKLEIRADFFNLFNNVNLTNITNSITDAAFGQAQGALGSRTITMQARFSF